MLENAALVAVLVIESVRLHLADGRLREAPNLRVRIEPPARPLNSDIAPRLFSRIVNAAVGIASGRSSLGQIIELARFTESSR